MNDPIRLFYSPTIDDKGIIGADPGNQFNISGVAYDSSFLAYRVLGCTASVTDDSKSLYLARTYLQFTFFYLVIVEALCTDGQDILTLLRTDGWTGK